ncbi:MAG: Lrp/AsnC family transcriptional regulator [Thaumarchaeota archaeon]|jgi:DNA-binding Lrp family transcriptional regulator|nr:Lrp/AsnC family transcriptional regulator [Nitrososphaerota archaeon]
MVVKAYVFLVTKPGTSIEVSNEMKKIKGVHSADPIYGRFDVVAAVEAESPEELTRLLYEVIERIPNIVRTETSIVLQ